MLRKKLILVSLLLVFSAGAFVRADGEEMPASSVDDAAEDDLDVSDVPETASTSAGADGAEQQKQEISREVFERVLSTISEDCKSQLQAATSEENPSEMSDECKLQVQQAVMAAQTESYKPPKKSDFISEDASDPTWIILAFTGTLVAGIGGYIVHANKELSKIPRKKRKPLSKKKKAKQQRGMGSMM